ncbi:LysE family translocator [uncultured Thalassospira sp.]|jgi:threonine/homoserine/homoserine lactone efflux protein|uniref:LysE family translocator n=1 Tax=uncultured Thalassospira sp. TaxID=404382 RepID=UPI0030D750FC|tara:strand:+ start:726 stop:1325 length:600 start_codon:yes stop_codon:yes gene_type:complete
MSANLSLYLSMASFALVASITPGPVNILVLGNALQYGFRPSLRPVFGATAGFCLLFLLIGLGLHQLLTQSPEISLVIKWAGIAFLLYLAFKLATDSGQIGTTTTTKVPSIMAGATLQWLNPKAWMASVAGMGAFIGDGNTTLLLQFVALYFVICFSSVGCWAVAGAFLRRYLNNAVLVRRFNRCMALLLAASAVYLMMH